MKIHLVVLALSIGTAGRAAQTYTIADRTFYPASSEASAAGYLKEYVPAGQSLKNWTNLFAVRWFRDQESPKDYIDHLGLEHERRYPGMKYASGEQESKNRWFVDFLAYPKEKHEPNYFEWDFFRAQTNAGGGILVFQYAERRPYHKSIEETKGWDIKDLRNQLLPFLMTNEFIVEPDASLEGKATARSAAAVPRYAVLFDFNRDSRQWSPQSPDEQSQEAILEFVPHGDSLEAWRELVVEQVALTATPLHEFVEAWKQKLSKANFDLQLKEDVLSDGSVLVSYSSQSANETGMRRFIQGKDGIYMVAYEVRPSFKNEGIYHTWEGILHSARLVRSSDQSP